MMTPRKRLATDRWHSDFLNYDPMPTESTANVGLPLHLNQLFLSNPLTDELTSTFFCAIISRSLSPMRNRLQTKHTPGSTHTDDTPLPTLSIHSPPVSSALLSLCTGPSSRACACCQPPERVGRWPRIVARWCEQCQSTSLR